MYLKDMERTQPWFNTVGGGMEAGVDASSLIPHTFPTVARYLTWIQTQPAAMKTHNPTHAGLSGATS